MKFVVCYKIVPDDSSLGVAPDNSLDFSKCEWEIGQYDLRAVEIAAKLTETDPANVLIALTAGGDIVEHSKLKKSILSRGPHEMIAIKDEALAHADSAGVAAVLAEAIRKLGDVDAVFFGEGSGDVYAQQVGNLTGALLGWNTVNAASHVELKGDSLLIERNLETCTEVISLCLPAAVSVTSDICLPRLASMKEILKAGKKPSLLETLEDYENKGERKLAELSLKALAKTDERACNIVSDDEAGIAAVAAAIKKL